MLNVVCLYMPPHIPFPGVNFPTFKAFPHRYPALRGNLYHLCGDYHVKIHILSTYNARWLNIVSGVFNILTYFG